MPPFDAHDLAHELLDTLDSGHLIDPPTSRYDGLDLATAYTVAAEITRLRIARGEQPVGRKIGYTNRNIWQQYNVYAPIWGHMYEHTVHGDATMSLAKMVSPRIEPEIAFKLRSPVPAGCTAPADVLQHVEWLARSFEIVDCHYAGWKFTAPDSVLDFSHHAALVVGEPLPLDSHEITHMVEALASCTVTLAQDGALVETGIGANALGHPALALAFLADALAEQPTAPPLQPGEIITTGTLTSAMPIARGETWSTETSGLPVTPLTVTCG